MSSSSSSSSIIPPDPWQRLSPFPAAPGSERHQGSEHPAFQGLTPAAESPIPPSRHFPSLCTREWSHSPKPLISLATSSALSGGSTRSSLFPNPGALNVQAD